MNNEIKLKKDLPDGAIKLIKLSIQQRNSLIKEFNKTKEKSSHSKDAQYIAWNSSYYWLCSHTGKQTVELNDIIETNNKYFLNNISIDNKFIGTYLNRDKLIISCTSNNINKIKENLFKIGFTGCEYINGSSNLHIYLYNKSITYNEYNTKHSTISDIDFLNIFFKKSENEKNLREYINDIGGKLILSCNAHNLDKVKNLLYLNNFSGCKNIIVKDVNLVIYLYDNKIYWASFDSCESHMSDYEFLDTFNVKSDISISEIKPAPISNEKINKEIDNLLDTTSNKKRYIFNIDNLDIYK